MAQSKALQKRKLQFAATSDWSEMVIESKDGISTLSLRQCYDALVQCDGRMAQASYSLDVNLQSFGRLVQSVPALREVVELHREMMLDEAEGTVRTAVRKGDAMTALTVLRTAGKHRGWTDRDVIGTDTKIEICYVNDWRPALTDVESDAAAIIDAEPESLAAAIAVDATSEPAVPRPTEGTPEARDPNAFAIS